MYIQKVKVKNFRMLVDVELALDEGTTLIVGRNNSGKTSLSEVIQRFVGEKQSTFRIEDFSIASYDAFCSALKAKGEGAGEDEIRRLLPVIELNLLFRYDQQQMELGTLSDFVIDLNLECTEALIIARYELRDGAIEDLLANQPARELTDQERTEFFQELRERVPKYFEASLWAQDPNDSSNIRRMEVGALRKLLKSEVINAQRGLDDTTLKDSDELSKTIEVLYTAASSPTADQGEQTIAQALRDAVRDIQKTIEGEFKGHLRNLVPTLESFGFPGLDGPDLESETTLSVERLLTGHTKLRFKGKHGILLPESYSGLGIRNLLLILFQVVSFYKTFRAMREAAPMVYLIFVEEPEAHLHPQMQEVFIRQVTKIAAQLSEQEGAPLRWPAQFVISTHSSHVANAARFESIRYFLPVSIGTHRTTKIKDLRTGLSNIEAGHKEFLHQYLTLTKCDLFFADKAILIEGTSERVLLPPIISKLELSESNLPRLSSQYITTLEVGGAYAHIFFELLEFLELRTLIITDIDSVDQDGKACPVHQSIGTSNACIKDWFHDEECSPKVLVEKDSESKVQNIRRIAYQLPESDGGPCGRTLEDSFMLANLDLFKRNNETPKAQEEWAWNECMNIKKSQFALEHAIQKTNWSPPRYILEGLRWLATASATTEKATSGNPTVLVVRNTNDS